MKKIFISQPMIDKTDDEIKAVRAEIAKKIAKKIGEEVEIVDSFFEGAPHDAKPLWFLGKSFQLLSTADIAVFGGEWYKYRGCKMEFKAATEYGIEVMFV